MNTVSSGISCYGDKGTREINVEHTPIVNGGMVSNRIKGINANTGEQGELGEYDTKVLQLVNWFTAIRDRICKTYISCGDWIRICKSDSMRMPFTCGIFLDPPYKGTEYVYSDNKKDIYKEVQEFCLSLTNDKRVKIILAGRGDEHDELLKHGWTKEYWQAGGGYARSDKAKKEAKLECLWISPSCNTKKEETQTQLKLV